MKNRTIVYQLCLLLSSIAFSLFNVSCVHERGNVSEEERKITSSSQDSPSSTTTILSGTIKDGLPSSETPVVNVYMENSGSMFGYVDVNQKSMFQQAVYKYLVDIQSTGISSNFHLNFINEGIIDKGTDINRFVNNITASDFRDAPGNNKTTDLAEMLTMVLNNTSGDTVSVFISDCIFSPGKKNSPQAYLNDQSTKLLESFSSFLDNNPFTMVMIYQLTSPFKGKYYDYQNNGRRYEGNRPFYFIVIGNTYHLLKMKDKISFDKFKDGVKNYWAIFNFPFEEIEPLKYNLLLSPKKGSFDRKGAKQMEKPKNDSNGEFLFTIAADMSIYQLLLEKDYIMNVDNYARQINKQDAKEFFMKIVEDQIATSPMTLDYQISTSQPMMTGDFSLVLQRNIPQWAVDMSDDDDRNFNQGNEMKTYGLRYIFDGIEQAYETKVGKVYTSFDIKVEK